MIEIVGGSRAGVDAEEGVALPADRRGSRLGRQLGRAGALGRLERPSRWSRRSARRALGGRARGLGGAVPRAGRDMGSVLDLSISGSGYEREPAGRRMRHTRPCLEAVRCRQWGCSPDGARAAALVRQLAMEADGPVYRGRTVDVDVVAMLTTIGMAAGARAAERILDLGVDHVIVVGIAGGVDRALQIGDVIVPEVVLDRESGRTYRPSATGDVPPRGTLSCADELTTDPGQVAEMRAGVVAVDMETAAVAAVCEGAGCPSVYRGFSDFADEGLVDDELFALTRPEGTADPDAVARYLEERPERRRVLERLAGDTAVTPQAAAAAAIRACATL